MSRNQSPVESSASSLASTPIRPEENTPVSASPLGLEESKSPVIDIPLDKCLIDAIIESQQARIKEVKATENRHISDIKRIVSARIINMAAGVQNMVTSLQETLTRQNEMKQAKKDLYKKTAIAMIAMAAGPFYKIAEESFSAAAYVTGIFVATIAGLVASHREQTDEIMQEICDEDATGWVLEHKPLEHMRKLDTMYDTFLDASTDKAHLLGLLQQAWTSILAEKDRDLPDQEFERFLNSESQKRAALEARLSTLVVDERQKMLDDKLAKHARDLGDHLQADHGDVFCLYASVIADLCSKQDKKNHEIPLYTTAHNSIVNPKQFTATATTIGTHKILGGFIQRTLQEQFAKRPLPTDIGELFTHFFPNVKRETYHLYSRGHYNYKRTHMIVAMKVFADQFKGVPISMVTKSDRLTGIARILSIAMATPEFNKHKVNPVIWLLRNSTMGRTLLKDMTKDDLNPAFAEAKRASEQSTTYKASSIGSSPFGIFRSESGSVPRPHIKSPGAPPLLPGVRCGF